MFNTLNTSTINDNKSINQSIALGSFSTNHLHQQSTINKTTINKATINKRTINKATIEFVILSDEENEDTLNDNSVNLLLKRKPDEKEFKERDEYLKLKRIKTQSKQSCTITTDGCKPLEDALSTRSDYNIQNENVTTKQTAFSVLASSSQAAKQQQQPSTALSQN